LTGAPDAGPVLIAEAHVRNYRAQVPATFREGGTIERCGRSSY
jgi:hypothetical protein